MLLSEVLQYPHVLPQATPGQHAALQLHTFNSWLMALTPALLLQVMRGRAVTGRSRRHTATSLCRRSPACTPCP